MAEKKQKDVNVSIRLPSDTHRTLQMVASGEGTSVGEIIRVAIDQYLNPTGKENG